MFVATQRAFSSNSFVITFRSITNHITTLSLKVDRSIELDKQVIMFLTFIFFRLVVVFLWLWRVIVLLTHRREKGYSLQLSTMCKWATKNFLVDIFGLWKLNIQTILTKHKCIEEFKGGESMLGCLTQEEKTKMMDKTRSVVILCLGVKVIREVSREKNTASIWEKFKSL